MEAVKVWNWPGHSVLLIKLVRIPDGDEAYDDGRDGQQVEGGVQELGPDATAATATAIDQHG